MNLKMDFKNHCHTTVLFLLFCFQNATNPRAWRHLKGMKCADCKSWTKQMAAKLMSTCKMTNSWLCLVWYVLCCTNWIHWCKPSKFTTKWAWAWSSVDSKLNSCQMRKTRCNNCSTKIKLYQTKTKWRINKS